MTKRLIRESYQRLKTALGDPPAETGPLDSWALPYTLNPLYVRLMEKEQCAHRYVWPALHSANLARNLGLEAISFIEFGVAGGNSLVRLERIAEKLEDILGLRISVYGFDTGTGMPPSQDYRDMPNLWREGYFKMDPEALQRRLRKADLRLGPVAQTIPGFLASPPAPVAFIAFDLDYYTSTMHAFQLLEAEEKLLLPRVYCYFDDILGYTFCEFNGELLAINEFNVAHPMRKIALIPGIRYYVPERFANEMWEKYYMLHIFDHVLYGQIDGSIDKQEKGSALVG